MVSDEMMWSASARRGGARLPVCVYGTLRTGQAARARLLDGEDVVAVAAARIPDHRLAAVGAGSPRWAGYAMAVPAAGESVVAELVVLHPDRHDEALAALDDYEFEDHSPTDPSCPYHRRRTDVALPLDEWGVGPPVVVPAWVYLPGAPLREMRLDTWAVPGGDWSRWDPGEGQALVGAASRVPVGGSR